MHTRTYTHTHAHTSLSSSSCGPYGNCVIATVICAVPSVYYVLHKSTEITMNSEYKFSCSSGELYCIVNPTQGQPQFQAFPVYLRNISIYLRGRKPLPRILKCACKRGRPGTRLTYSPTSLVVDYQPRTVVVGLTSSFFGDTVYKLPCHIQYTEAVEDVTLTAGMIHNTVDFIIWEWFYLS